MASLQDYTKHFCFITKVTGILADTMKEIHEVLDQAMRDSSANLIHHPRRVDDKGLPDQALEISISENNSDENFNPEIDVGMSSVSRKKSSDRDRNERRERKNKKKKKIARWETEGKPRPPLNAFMLFLKQSKSEIMQARPDLTPPQVSIYASNLWAEMQAEEKGRYIQEYQENRQKYMQTMKAYKRKKLKEQQEMSRQRRVQKKHKKSRRDGECEIVNVDDSEENNSQQN